MRVRIRVAGRNRLEAKLRRVSAAVERAVAGAVQAGAADVREAARELLDQPRAGGPSAPGEPPRKQSGRLRDNIFVRSTDDGLGAEVGTDLDYGAHLEFGTQKMAARPWLLPAFEAAKPRIRARIAAAVREALNRATP
ncbi:MAG: HK97-gp10 family putative phage morphogenesis protein [Kiloniellaceae bacterium]